MNKIIFKQQLAPNIKKFIIQAPIIAEKVLPGQFVIVIVDEKGERIPLTVVSSDKQKGSITLIFQELGKTTYKLGELNVGEDILHVLGPLGKATEIAKFGTVITVAGGVGIAEVYPVTDAFKQAEQSYFYYWRKNQGSFIFKKRNAESKQQAVCDHR
jgi:ferredoxin--NADP+ reductase